jgi:hypothetical protein
MSSMNIKKPKKVKLFFGILYSRKHLLQLENALNVLKKKYGTFESISDDYVFSSITDYYDEELGPNLRKRIYVCSKTIDPEKIVDIKLFTNSLEDKLALKHKPLKRAVNVDAGYFSINNLVLVTTKNFAHRIYLKKGIYAELTLIFKKHGIHELEWTYPDFRQDMLKNFFIIERAKLLVAHNKLKELKTHKKQIIKNIAKSRRHR